MSKGQRKRAVHIFLFSSCIPFIVRNFNLVIFFQDIERIQKLFYPFLFIHMRRRQLWSPDVTGLYLPAALAKITNDNGTYTPATFGGPKVDQP